MSNDPQTQAAQYPARGSGVFGLQWCCEKNRYLVDSPGLGRIWESETRLIDRLLASGMTRKQIRAELLRVRDFECVDSAIADRQGNFRLVSGCGALRPTQKGFLFFGEAGKHE